MPTRILIVGGPKTGKTTLALKMAAAVGLTPKHTDDLIDKLDWSAASATVAEWMDEPGNLLIEGVAVPRALRKWLAAHPEGKPADRVIYLSQSHQELTKGQLAMTKGVATVWREIAAELLARGVDIMFDPVDEVGALADLP